LAFFFEDTISIAFPDMKKSDLESMDVVESHLFHGNDKFSLSHEELIEKEKECLKFILQQVFSYLLFWVHVVT
jgi:hypothetical protein